jgi:hypothetical protein
MNTRDVVLTDKYVAAQLARSPAVKRLGTGADSFSNRDRFWS